MCNMRSTHPMTVVFGLDASAGTFYAFVVQPYLQEYALTCRTAGEWVTLVPFTHSSHIAFDKALNRLKVKRSGSQIQLFVNDRFPCSHTDSTYTGTRRVGIYAASGPESPIWLRYDDFTMWSTGQAARSASKGKAAEIPMLPAPARPDCVDGSEANRDAKGG
jgi:hypothetical protein